jgi:hypothetical protein
MVKTKKKEALLRKRTRIEVKRFLNSAMSYATKVTDDLTGFSILSSVIFDELTVMLARGSRPPLSNGTAGSLFLASIAGDLANIPFENVRISIIDERQLKDKFKCKSKKGRNGKKKVKKGNKKS